MKIESSSDEEYTTKMHEVYAKDMFSKSRKYDGRDTIGSESVGSFRSTRFRMKNMAKTQIIPSSTLESRSNTLYRLEMTTKEISNKKENILLSKT